MRSLRTRFAHTLCQNCTLHFSFHPSPLSPFTFDPMAPYLNLYPLHLHFVFQQGTFDSDDAGFKHCANLIWNNCVKYNDPKAEISIWAMELKVCVCMILQLRIIVLLHSQTATLSHYHTATPSYSQFSCTPILLLLRFLTRFQTPSYLDTLTLSHTFEFAHPHTYAHTHPFPPKLYRHVHL
jgi:hypothetical protein